MIGLGERFRLLREEKGLLQREVAEKLGLTRVAVTNYEQDNRVPDPETLKKIADLFGVSVDYLLGRTDDPAPPATPTVAKDPDEAELDRVLQEHGVFLRTKGPLTKADKQQVYNFIQFLVQERRRKGDSPK